MMNLVRMHRDPLFSNLVNQMKNEFDYEKKASPAVNVLENENEFNLQVSLPGWSKENVKVEIDKNLLTISGEVKEVKAEFIRKEFKTSSFERSFTLPKDVNMDHISAEHKDGILEITVPKDIEAKEKMKRLVSIS